MGKIKALKCRECGAEYEPTVRYACERCFSPLDVIYNYNEVELDRRDFHKRPKNIWRYFELLPIEDKSCIVDIGAGYTALQACENLAKELGVREVYVKNDTVNPTFSFKDRPASVSVSKALEFKMKAVGCASTGNLAAAVAAHAAKARLPCYVFIPVGLELNKVIQALIYGAKIVAVKGTYDDANRVAAQAADLYRLAIVNVNLRPYYVEGSKTLAFETCEQLGWRLPDRVIVPTASGALLNAIWRGFREFMHLGLVENTNVKITCAQPQGCSPVVNAYLSGSDDVQPIEEPTTIAKSLAIGDPGDGYYALKVIRETGGGAAYANDDEIIEAMKLLAKREGIFAEPAGAVTIAVLKKMIDNGEILPDEEVVCYVTGNGLKTTEVLLGRLPQPVEIEANISALEAIVR